MATNACRYPALLCLLWGEQEHATFCLACSSSVLTGVDRRCRARRKEPPASFLRPAAAGLGDAHQSSEGPGKVKGSDNANERSLDTPKSTSHATQVIEFYSETERLDFF